MIPQWFSLNVPALVCLQIFYWRNTLCVQKPYTFPFISHSPGAFIFDSCLMLPFALLHVPSLRIHLGSRNHE